MGFHLMSFVETDLGFVKEQDGYLLFFGKTSATLDQITQAYPKISFRSVHQKHTDICVLSTPDSQEIIADAHFTNEDHVGLIIKTADCMPILAYDKNKKLILAVHAGWRGVENQITSKSCFSTKLQSINIFFGPHILQKNFEVDADVKEQLQNTYLRHSVNPDVNVIMPKLDKFYIDLKAIVKTQIQSLSVPFFLHELTIDTVSDLRFHSYRRDKHNSGRNLSFIARLKS